MEDKEINLLISVANKDTKALEKIYDKYSAFLFTIINRILKNQEISIDVLTEVFAILWLKADILLSQSNNLYITLVNLSKNKAIDIYKRLNGLIDQPYTDAYENEFIIPKIFTQDDIDLDFLLRELESINSIFSQLTDAQMYLLSLLYFKGLRIDEISKELNLPVNTFNEKLKVAFSTLKENLTMAGF